MISTFDLTLLGSLVSAGGLVFLRHGTWPYPSWSLLGIGKRPFELSAESSHQHARSTALAGVRWLTVGVLTLFIAYVRGAEEGYLFSPWSDVMFHLVFVSTCWATTAFRMKHAAERASAVVLTHTSPSQASS
jgi:hypothetical protein